MPNASYIGSAKASATGSDHVVIPYAASSGTQMILGAIAQNIPIGIDHITDDGGNTWVFHTQDAQVTPTLENPTPVGDFEFEFWLTTTGHPTTSITVTYTGSATVINAIVAEYANASFNSFQVVNDNHGPALTEINYSGSNQSPIGFIVAICASAFTGPDIGGSERQKIGPNSEGAIISLVDNMSGGTISETTGTDAVGLSIYGFYTTYTPVPVNGNITITKATAPTGSAQSFDFNIYKHGSWSFVTGSPSYSGGLSTSPTDMGLNQTALASNQWIFNLTGNFTGGIGAAGYPPTLNAQFSSTTGTLTPITGSPAFVLDPQTLGSNYGPPPGGNGWIDLSANTTGGSASYGPSAGHVPKSSVTGAVTLFIWLPAGSYSFSSFVCTNGGVWKWVPGTLNQSFSLTDGQTQDSGALASGTYSVVETPVAGWTTGTSVDPTALVVTVGNTTPITYTNTSDCAPRSVDYEFLYIKSFGLKSGQDYTVALDQSGALWSENVNVNPGVFDVISHQIIPGTYMRSTTQDDFEYMCFSDLLQGTDIPRQYNPQPAVGELTLDRISQVGPGAPPQFQTTGAASTNQITITSWSGSGSTVTFQAVNSLVAGDLLNLSKFAVSTFFNGKTVQVLGTGLSGTQFQVSFPAFSGGSDTGLAVSQFGYPIQGITQNPHVSFFQQVALWSAGPGNVSAGNTITFYYRPGGSFNPYPALVNQFKSGSPVYVYVTGAPFGNGTSMVTSIGSGKPPGEGANVPYFTIGAASTNFYKVGGPNQPGNDGTFQLTMATINVSIPIPGVEQGNEITITGASPSGWNNTWTVVQTLNSGIFAVTQTQMSGGTATYTWTWAGSAASANAPTVGQLVTVIQTLNGNGVFNVTDAVITGVTGSATAGTFSISGFQSQDVDAAAENGQAETAGSSFQFDPGQVDAGTQSNPIFGNAAANTGIVTITGSNNAIGPGTRQGVVFFETRNGLKTACSAPATFTTDSTATYIVAESIPIGPPNVIRRWIAFTVAGPNGIPGPNFYTINEPVTYTINNQTYRYTATYIDDNVSTTAKFTFTDAILQAGEEIDVQGNNLFAQIELGSSAWNVAYADRMFYGLEQNKILNFTNLSFDGGYVPSGGTNVAPLGWTLDPASNIDTGNATVITSFSITANVVTIVTANTFIVGQDILIGGLSTGTYLNGQELTILTRSGSQFTAAFTHANVGSTGDTGTATPVSSSGTLLESQTFGNSYYIQNHTGATQSVLGMIVQSAAFDAYNVPILTTNTLYSVRVTARIPSGGTVGNLVVDLTNSNAGFTSGSSGTGALSDYGFTYGSFVLPFSEMTESNVIYTGTLLTTPFTNGVPTGLLLRVWAENIGYGDDVDIDRIEVYPTNLPVLTTNIRASYALNFEAFDGVTGNIGLAEHNQQPCFGAVELHDQLYFLQSGSMQSTQDVPGTEPSGPGGGWAVHEVSNRVGTCGIHAYDYGEEWILTACRNGLFGFNGGQPMRIDFQQKELWELINWRYGHTIWLTNDLANRRILVGVPLPTPNKWLPSAPVNSNPTTPNVMLMWNYQGLGDFEALVTGQTMHTTMFGNLVSTDMRLKMSIWQIPSPFTGLVTQRDLVTQETIVCGTELFKLDPDALADNTTSAINGTYFTYGFTSSDKAAEFPLLGLHRKRFTLTQQLITGSGIATVTAYPNYIYTPSTLVFNTMSSNVPIALVEQPIDDITRPWNVGGNRVFFSYSTNAVGAAFNLSKLIAVGIADPFAAVNPNAG